MKLWNPYLGKKSLKSLICLSYHWFKFSWVVIKLNYKFYTFIYNFYFLKNRFIEVELTQIKLHMFKVGIFIFNAYWTFRTIEIMNVPVIRRSLLTSVIFTCPFTIPTPRWPLTFMPLILVQNFREMLSKDIVQCYILLYSISEVELFQILAKTKAWILGERIFPKLYDIWGKGFFQFQPHLSFLLQLKKKRNR